MDPTDAVGHGDQLLFGQDGPGVLVGGDAVGHVNRPIDGMGRMGEPTSAMLFLKARP
jgi:hypothetical protein